MQEAVKVCGLSKCFRLSAKQQRRDRSKSKYKQAVKDVSFCVYRGEIFGLLGPNGAGKTTIMRMLATLLRPDAGQALVEGASIVTEQSTVRSRIAFLTSDLKLEYFFTPSYLFDYFAALHGIAPKMRDGRKKELFGRFGIDRFAETKVAELSQGMRQKVSIAISLVHDPDIIIFDEPTNGLDVLTAKIVTDYLRELRELGKTIIVSTHIFGLIEKLCDRVGILIDGEMVTCGSVSTVCAGKRLEERFFDLYAEKTGGTI